MKHTTHPVALITGGLSGIGRATAELLVRRGYKIGILDLSPLESVSSLDAAADDDRVIAHPGDVTDRAACEGLVEAIVERWRTVDALVTCAALRVTGTVVETTPEVWQQVVAVNLTGVFNACRAVLPVMVRQGAGSIVNIGSASGYGGEAQAAYAAAKGGILALSTSLALDHRADHIRVNVVAPGSTRTAMNAGRDPRVDQAIVERSCVSGELNTPEDVAESIAFLLSNAARNISGAVLDVGYFHGEPVRKTTLA